jgi:hypothetical protein
MARNINGLVVPSAAIARQTIADYPDSGLGAVAAALQSIYGKTPDIRHFNRSVDTTVLVAASSSYAFPIFTVWQEGALTGRSLTLGVWYKNSAAFAQNLGIALSDGTSLNKSLSPAGSVTYIEQSFSIANDQDQTVTLTTAGNTTLFGVVVFDSLGMTELPVGPTGAGIEPLDDDEFDYRSPYSPRAFHAAADVARFVALNRPGVFLSQDLIAVPAVRNLRNIGHWFAVPVPRCPYPTQEGSQVHTIEWRSYVATGNLLNVEVTVGEERKAWQARGTWDTVYQDVTIQDDVPWLYVRVNSSWVGTASGSLFLVGRWMPWSASTFDSYLDAGVDGEQWYPLADENGNYIVDGAGNHICWR